MFPVWPPVIHIVTAIVLTLTHNPKADVPVTPPVPVNPPHVVVSSHAQELPLHHAQQLLSVTAYCLHGTKMKNGEYPYAGVAAGNYWPLGTHLDVQGYGTVTVDDRIGHGSDLDVWMSSCAQAIQFGRQTKEVAVV